MKTTNKDIIELVNTGAYTEKEAYEFSINELHILNAHDQADELRKEAIGLGILNQQFCVMDNTSNTGRDYIGEDGENVSLEENAKRFDSREEAEEYAKTLDPEGEWSWVSEID